MRVGETRRDTAVDCESESGFVSQPPVYPLFSQKKHAHPDQKTLFSLVHTATHNAFHSLSPSSHVQARRKHDIAPHRRRHAIHQRPQPRVPHDAGGVPHLAGGLL